MPDPHELRLLPRLIAPRRRVSFPIPRLPLLLYFSIGSIRSLAIHLSSLTSWRFSQKTKSWQRTQPPADPSSVTRAIFTHARTGGTKRSNRGTVPWLTFEPFTFSRTLTYIYIYIFFLERRLNILDRIVYFYILLRQFCLWKFLDRGLQRNITRISCFHRANLRAKCMRDVERPCIPRVRG